MIMSVIIMVISYVKEENYIARRATGVNEVTWLLWEIGAWMYENYVHMTWVQYRPTPSENKNFIFFTSGSSTILIHHENRLWEQNGVAKVNIINTLTNYT